MDNISMLIEFEDVDDILKVLNANNGKIVNHIVRNLAFGITNNVKLLPIFELKDTVSDHLLVICLPEKNYKRTLKFMKDWAIELEEFESAGKTVELLKQI